jgi:hypothetical protein
VELQVSQELREAAEKLGLARRTVGLEDTTSSSDDDSSSSSSDASDDSRDRPSSYILEISDDQGEGEMAGLLEEASGFVLGVCTTGRMLVPPQEALPALANLRLLTYFRRVSVSQYEPKALGALLAGMFQEMILTLSFRLLAHSQAGTLLCGVRTHLSLPEDNTVQVGIVAMALSPSHQPRIGMDIASPATPTRNTSNVNRDPFDTATSESHDGGEADAKIRSEEKPPAKGLDMDEAEGVAGGRRQSSFSVGGDMEGSVQTTPSTPFTSGMGLSHPVEMSNMVELTNLSSIPGTRVLYHIDRVLVCMIREVLRGEEPGGNMTVWMGRLLFEGQAMCRAQAAAMGGNAVLHYNVQQCMMNAVAGKQRVYSVLIISGDAVCVTRGRSNSLYSRPR